MEGKGSLPWKAREASPCRRTTCLDFCLQVDVLAKGGKIHALRTVRHVGSTLLANWCHAKRLPPRVATAPTKLQVHTLVSTCVACSQDDLTPATNYWGEIACDRLKPAATLKQQKPSSLPSQRANDNNPQPSSEPSQQSSRLDRYSQVILYLLHRRNRVLLQTRLPYCQTKGSTFIIMADQQNLGALLAALSMLPPSPVHNIPIPYDA